MSNELNDYLSSFSGLIIIIIPLLREALKSGQKSRQYITFLLIMTPLLFWFGCNTVKRSGEKDATNAAEMKKATKNIQHLDTTVQNLSTAYRNDTVRFADFKKTLLEKFHIKDSANVPIQQVIINNIGKVRYLKQF